MIRILNSSQTNTDAVDTNEKFTSAESIPPPIPKEPEVEDLIKTFGESIKTFQTISPYKMLHWEVRSDPVGLFVRDNLCLTTGFFFRYKTHPSLLTPEDRKESFKEIMDWLDTTLPHTLSWPFKFIDIEIECDRRLS